MKRRALVKTIVDVFKIIGGMIGGVAVISIGSYLFIMIPLWILNYFDLLEKYGNYPAGVIYVTEFSIIAGVISVSYFIRKLYLANLKELETSKKKITNAEHIRGLVQTDDGLADFIDMLDSDGIALHYCKNLQSCEELVGTKELNKKCRQCLLNYLKKYTHDESGGN